MSCASFVDQTLQLEEQCRRTRLLHLCRQCRERLGTLTVKVGESRFVASVALLVLVRSRAAPSVRKLLGPVVDVRCSRPAG